MFLDLMARESERKKVIRQLKMALFRAERILDARLESSVAELCLRYIANPNTKLVRMLPDGFFFTRVLPTISDFSHSEAEKLSMIADFAKMLVVSIASSYHIDLTKKEMFDRQQFFRDNPLVN